MYEETCPICYSYKLHYQTHRGTDKYGRYIEYMCVKCGSDFRVHVKTKSQPKCKSSDREKHRYRTAGTHCHKRDRW